MLQPSEEKIHRSGRSDTLPGKRHLLMLVGAVVVSLVIAAAGNIPAGVYVVAPGTVESLGPAVRIVPDPSEAHPAGTEDIRLVTVRTWRASIADLAYAAVRSDVETVGGRAPDEPEEERERRRTAQLASSELVAQFVAFRAASVPISPTGSGARIEDLSSEPARRHLQVGDVITAVAGVSVGVAEDIRRAIAGKPVGDEVEVEGLREGRPFSVAVALSPGPDESRPQLLGVVVSTVDPRIDSPYKVDFELEGLGGSSAGLALALELYGRMAGKDLTAGRVVVATGELDLQGKVGAVGGVAQKAWTASRAGADVFVVPLANLEEALLYAGDTEVLGVSTFGEAVSALVALSAGD